MGSHGTRSLSVRTILVSTRAAVRSQRRAGEDEQARASAERGLQLLAELDSDGPSDLAEKITEARRQIEQLRDGDSS